MKRVVMFSGGIGSWYAARRVREMHGVKDMVLLFTDTKSEDDDLYRFIRDAAEDIGAPMVTVADGRTIWQVFHDERFLGNSRIAPCTRILKRQAADRWLAQNCDKADTACYVGIDWTEKHRFFGGPGRKGLQRAKSEQGWWYDAPLCRPPFVAKGDMIQAAKDAGLTPPRMYREGASHNNCAGQCVKGGIGHWAWLWRARPAVFLHAEREEQSLRDELGDVSILTETRKGVERNLTLRELRERLCGGEVVDMFAIGGCACFLEVES